VFVGRKTELARLSAAFEGARTGFGSVAMVAGEAGAGKTRLLREFEAFELERGVLVLWGGAREAGGASPYRPWEQALEGPVAAPDWDGLRGGLGTDGGEVARIAPGLRYQLPAPLATEANQEPNSARFQLYEGVTSFLKNVANATPLVVVLDDLHWADEATLQLLVHAPHELRRSRVMLVCAYRDCDRHVAALRFRRACVPHTPLRQRRLVPLLEVSGLARPFVAHRFAARPHPPRRATTARRSASITCAMPRPATSRSATRDPSGRP
jgi:hypothetical protein